MEWLPVWQLSFVELTSLAKFDKGKHGKCRLEEIFGRNNALTRLEWGRKSRICGKCNRKLPF
jgi:hypothetical protein